MPAVLTKPAETKSPAPIKPKADIPAASVKLTKDDFCDSAFHGYTGTKSASKAVSCRTPATVRVILDNGFLLFCSHHYEIRKDEIAPVTKRVDDQRVTEVKNRLIGSHN